MSTARVSTQSAAERRSAEAQSRELVAKLAPEYHRLVDSLQRWLRKRLPTAHELVYEYRDWFVISYAPSDRGYEGILAIRGSADGVRLYFNQGKGLSDPGKLLQGSGAQVRWIPVEGTATLERPEAVGLIEEAIARSPVPFAASGRGPIVIRAVAAKSRKRRTT